MPDSSPISEGIFLGRFFSGHLAVFQAVNEGTFLEWKSSEEIPGHLAIFKHGNEGIF